MDKNQKFLILIILFSILIRIPYLNCPIHPDEGGYAYQAYFWLKGINPYVSRFYNMLAGYPLLYAFIFKIFGTKVVNIRFFLAIWNAISVFFIYLTAKRLFDKRTALVSAFFYAYFSWLPLIKGNIGKEVFMLLPITLSLYFYTLYRDSLKKWTLFLTGISSSMAGVFKQSALLSWACFPIFIYIESPNRFKDIIVFIFGASLPIIPCFIYGFISLGPKLFLNDIIFYRINADSIFSGYWWYHALRFLYSINKTGIIFLIIALILGAKFIKKGPVWYFLIFYLFFSFLGVALGGDWCDHYYAQLLPALCLLLGLESVKIWQSKKRYYVLTNLILLILPLLIYILVGLERHSICSTFFEHGLTPKIADYIKTHSYSKDTIYAFLYYNPGICFLAQRESAFPYLFKEELLFEPDHFNSLMKFIDSKKRPHYFITYTEKESLKIARMHCESKGGIIKKIKRCFSTGFYVFCKDYPIQLSLIKQAFKTIPKYYIPVKTIPFDDTKVIIWEKRP